MGLGRKGADVFVVVRLRLFTCTCALLICLQQKLSASSHSRPFRKEEIFACAVAVNAFEDHSHDMKFHKDPACVLFLFVVVVILQRVILF